MYLNVSRKISSFDEYVIDLKDKYLKNKFLDKIMPFVTYMGNMGTIWIAIAAYLFFVKSYEPIGYIVILTLVVSTTVGEGIVKHIVRRVRPCNLKNSINTLIRKPISYSFPSGHTVSSFAAAGVLSAYFEQYRILFLLIAFLIAFSRLYLNVHYPTDVVAGIILGMLCTKLIFIILQQGYLEDVRTAFKYIF